jgi:hypothetical protein
MRSLSLENPTVSRQAGRQAAGRHARMLANPSVSRLRAAGGWMAAPHPHGSDVEDYERAPPCLHPRL